MSEELNVLKARAKQMNIDFHPSIGLAKLKAKLNAEIAGEKSDINLMQVEEEFPEAPVAATKRVSGPTQANLPKESIPTRNARLRKEASALIRVRITCMNPNKREWDGEIFTVSNAVVGTFKKYVPFNIDDGWHVPQILVNMLKDRKCQIFYNKIGLRGNKTREGKLVPEFNVEIMTPLTGEEIKELASQQALAANID